MSLAVIAVDVSLEAGHRYTVAAMGQKEDAHAQALVIDETAAVAKARTAPEQNIMIVVNNLAGAKTLSFLEDGLGAKDVPYGNFVTAPIKFGHVDHLVNTVNGDQLLGEPPGDFDELAGIDAFHVTAGHFPGNVDDTIWDYDGPSLSALNVAGLLQQVSDVHPVWDDGAKLTFNTFLWALAKTGLESQLNTGTYLIFAPTDAAFEALPKDQLAALLADPKALAKVLRYHIVAGYYPFGGLSGAVFGNYDRIVVNLQGMPLKLNGDLRINGKFVSALPSITVINGTRIVPVTQVLLPPEQ
jgi:uncharacterized surface protein with fasciclin (FAS1) repeats